MISIMKKSIHLLLLAGIAFLAASCFQSGPSTARYRILADFEYAVSADNLSYFQDSLFSAEIIPLDNLSSLCSKVENGVTVGGWTLSIMRDSLAKDGTLSPFASAGKTAGYKGSSVYAVYYGNPDPNRMAKYDIFFNFVGYSVHTCQLQECKIANTSAVLKAFDDGLFSQGDFLKVTATGYLEEKTVGTPVSIYLVDYRNAVPELVRGWETFDLSKIEANVDAVKFDIATSKLEIPRYFCMDNFAASIYVEY